jgi:hypothetical protein
LPVDSLGVKAILVLLPIVLFSTSAFAWDSQAGMVAARDMGLAKYVEFKNHGKTDSAALFYWRGNWWIYHPSYGSMRTEFNNVKSNPLVAALTIDGATGPLKWKPVPRKPMTARLANGCLPRAIAEARKNGGGILVTANHAQALSPDGRPSSPTFAAR